MKKLFLFLLVLCIFICTGCNKAETDNYVMSVVAPSGAPAVAITNLATTYQDDYDVTVGLAADALQPAFVSKEKDVIIAPINLGANMYSKNGNYVLAAVLTWGNLYFASHKDNFSINDLNEANVVFFGEGTINDVIVKHVLDSKNIIPSNIQYLGDTSATQSQLLSNNDAIVLIAEPALSAAKNKDSNIKSISVQELYEEVANNNAFPQAGCFINEATIKEHKKEVNKFVERLEASANAANNSPDAVAAQAVNLGIATPAPVLAKAIPNCNINFVKALQAKTAIEYAVSLKPQIFGGANPQANFYYA